MSRSRQDIVDYLSGFVTPERIETMDRVISNRTRYITVALEDIYQSHNASAVLRTCECFGIQDIHIIENKNRYTINPDVALGATKWLNLVKYNREDYNSLEAIESLKKAGYRIVATSLSDKATPLEKFDLEKGKAALFFGTELTGLTIQMLNQADEHLRIPIFGFTESFNISVSSAIIIHNLIQNLRKSDISWQLSQQELIRLKYTWLMNSVRRADLLEKRFLDEENKNNQDNFK